MKVAKFIFLRIVVFLLDYLSYFPYTVFVVEMFAVSLMILVDSPLERALFLVISYTPFLGFWGQNTFNLGTSEVMRFLSIWSFIILLIHHALAKVTRIRLGNGAYLAIAAILHLAAIARLWSVPNMWSTILTFFVVSLLSFFTFRGLHKIADLVLARVRQENL